MAIGTSTVYRLLKYHFDLYAVDHSTRREHLLLIL
jgi:hypothetical protein